MKIGLLGFGHVGSAVVQVLAENADVIARRAACPLELVAVATRTPAKLQGKLPAGCRVCTDIAQIIDDPAIDVVVELIGGATVAHDAVLRAIDQGKHVVTANKALLALHGQAIFARARQRGVVVAYEAAVAVAIPIIKMLREALGGNRIDCVAGIVNGTSNFILTQMREQGVEYPQALAEAQRLGYAEADPTLDVDGTDAAHKLTLLAALAFGLPLDFAAVQRQGITQVQRVDLLHAEQLGYRIQLIALATRGNAGVAVAVQPMLVPHSHPLAQVNGALNGICVQGNVSGPLFAVGAGAGGRPTASAVVADLLDVARQRQVPAAQHIALAGFHLPQGGRPGPAALEQSAWYVRMTVADEVGTLSHVAAALSRHAISIHSVRQDKPQKHHTDLALITHACTDAALDQACAEMARLPQRTAPLVRWRVARLPAVAA